VSGFISPPSLCVRENQLSSVMEFITKTIDIHSTAISFKKVLAYYCNYISSNTVDFDDFVENAGRSNVLILLPSKLNSFFPRGNRIESKWVLYEII